MVVLSQVLLSDRLVPETYPAGRKRPPAAPSMEIRGPDDVEASYSVPEPNEAGPLKPTNRSSWLGAGLGPSATTPWFAFTRGGSTEETPNGPVSAVVSMEPLPSASTLSPTWENVMMNSALACPTPPSNRAKAPSIQVACFTVSLPSSLEGIRGSGRIERLVNTAGWSRNIDLDDNMGGRGSKRKIKKSVGFERMAGGYSASALPARERRAAENCGEWIRTTDLQVMSLASCHCSTPRLVRAAPPR